MTTDLWMLIATSVLSLLIPTIYVTGRMQTAGGVPWAFGNRDTPLRVPPWADRAERAHRNLTENLAPFVALVLTAHVAGKANGTTALGAELFFVGRVAHVLVYTAGLTPWRTLAFAVGLVGEVMILLQICR